MLCAIKLYMNKPNIGVYIKGHGDKHKNRQEVRSSEIEISCNTTSVKAGNPRAGLGSGALESEMLEKENQIVQCLVRANPIVNFTSFDDIFSP